MADLGRKREEIVATNIEVGDEGRTDTFVKEEDNAKLTKVEIPTINLSWCEGVMNVWKKTITTMKGSHGRLGEKPLPP